MNHLVPKNHVSRTLCYLLPIVIRERQDPTDRPQRDATVPGREIKPRVRRVLLFVPVFLTRGFATLRFCCEWRNPAIGRVDNQRRLAIRFSIVEPAGRQRHDPTWSPCFEPRELLTSGHFLGHFLVSENGASSQLRVALHRSLDHAGAGPHALQIRIAPRRLWLFPGLGS